MYAEANRLVLSRDIKAPIVSADLVDGNREFQTVGAVVVVVVCFTCDVMSAT